MNHTKVWKIYILQKVEETGEATKDTYDEMFNIKTSTRERVRGFIERAPKFDGNPEVMFKWYENVETHLLNDDWETILDKVIKRMMVSCLIGATRKEIIHFFKWE
jgi:hypothetical protein